MAPPRRRSIAAAALAAAALAAGTRAASAHGPGGEHDAPAWCGAALAAITDAGLLIHDGAQTRTVAPFAVRLFAWSPDCSRIATVGDRVRVVTAATGAVADLGPIPPRFGRAATMDWIQPSIVWSPSGGRFAAAFGDASTRGHDGVVLFDVARARGDVLAFPTGEIAAFSLLDDTSAIASVHPGGMGAPFQLRAATASAGARIGQADWKDLAISAAPVVVVGEKNHGDLVAVDARTGAERALAKGISFLEGVSPNGAFAFFKRPDTGGPNGALVALPVAGGPLTVFVVGKYSGSANAADHGWAPSGTILVEHDHNKLDIDDGRGAPRRLYDGGTPANPYQRLDHDISHIRVSPDGRRASFLLESETGRLSSGYTSRVDLVIVELSGPPILKVVAPVAQLKHILVD